MDIIEEHTSPDRLLRLIVTRGNDGDVSIGFANYPWHTHGDILASLAGLPPMEAVRQFVKRIVSDEQIIAVSGVRGAVRDVWPTDDPHHELKHKPADETLEFRRWSGRIVHVARKP